MKRPTMLLIITFLAAHSLTGSEDGFVVAGEIAFSEDGPIYVELVTEETFGRNGGSPYRAFLEPEEGMQMFSFRFEAIPSGQYVLRAFQDKNRDGKLNMGPLGPREPVGMHRRPERMRIPPRFDASSFPVEGDVTDIRIELN